MVGDSEAQGADGPRSWVGDTTYSVYILQTDELLKAAYFSYGKTSCVEEGRLISAYRAVKREHLLHTGPTRVYINLYTQAPL